MDETLLIIPSYLKTNTHAKVLYKCVGTLRESTEENILIIDDGSPVEGKEKYYEELSDWVEDVEVILKEENSGFSSTVNVGLQRALDEGIDACLINADIEFKEYEWLAEAQESEADIVGALLFYPNMLIQHAGIYFSLFTRAFDHRFKGSPPNLPIAQVPIECPVTGALQFIRNSVLQDIGLYDEEFRLSMEDVDFCLRAIKAGHKSLYNPRVKAVHHESLFRGEANKTMRQWEIESRRRLLKKYKDDDFQGLVPTMMEKLIEA